MYILSIFGHKRLSMKKSPHWSLLHAFRLSKIESTIKHLLSWARQKSMRSYHNGVPRHHPTENSLEASPHWVAFVQSNLQCVFLGSHQYQKCPPPPSISHLQQHSWYYNYDPIPLSRFHLILGLPSHHTLNKGSLSLPHPTPIQIFPSPPSPFSESVRRLLHTFQLSPSRSWSRKHHCLG